MLRSILIGSISSVTGGINGLLHIFIATFYTYTYAYVTYTYVPIYVMSYIRQKTCCVCTFLDALSYLVYARL